MAKKDKDRSENELIVLTGARALKTLLRLSAKHNVSYEDLTNHPELGDTVKKLKDKIRLSRHVSDIRLLELRLNKAKIHPRKTKAGISRGKRHKIRRAAEAYRWNNTFRYPDILNLEDPIDAERYRCIFLDHINSGMPRQDAEHYAIRDYLKNL